jgi:hypothetical protein
VRADLPLRELVQLVAERRPVDPEALMEHLEALESTRLSERSLLHHTREVESILRTGEL